MKGCREKTGEWRILQQPERKNPDELHELIGVFENTPGNALLSHKVTLAVPSAQEGLTAVFGMGTGVAPPLMPPGISF